MSWKNYPSEFRCPACDGHGEITCGCCGNETGCKKCDGEGLVGINLGQMKADIASRYKDSRLKDGTWELVEGGEWVGRTDGVHKFFYRDYAISAEKQEAGNLPMPGPAGCGG